MKRLLCKIFGHRWDLRPLSRICDRCDRYEVPAVWRLFWMTPADKNKIESALEMR